MGGSSRHGKAEATSNFVAKGFRSNRDIVPDRPRRAFEWP